MRPVAGSMVGGVGGAGRGAEGRSGRGAGGGEARGAGGVPTLFLLFCFFFSRKCLVSQSITLTACAQTDSRFSPWVPITWRKVAFTFSTLMGSRQGNPFNPFTLYGSLSSLVKYKFAILRARAFNDGVDIRSNNVAGAISSMSNCFA